MESEKVGESEGSGKAVEAESPQEATSPEGDGPKRSRAVCIQQSSHAAMLYASVKQLVQDELAAHQSKGSHLAAAQICSGIGPIPDVRIQEQRGPSLDGSSQPEQEEGPGPHPPKPGPASPSVPKFPLSRPWCSPTSKRFPPKYPPTKPNGFPPKLPWIFGGITLPGIPEKAPPKLPWFLGGITLPSIPEKAPPELPGISRTALPSTPERTLPKLPWFLGGITLPSIPEKAPSELPGISGGALPSTPERTPPKLPWFLGGITLSSIPEKAPPKLPWFLGGITLPSIPEKAPPELPGISGGALPSTPERTPPKLPWFLGGIKLPSIPEKAPPETPGISRTALPSIPEKAPPKLPWFLGGITLPSIPEKAPSELPGISGGALPSTPERTPPKLPWFLGGVKLPSIPEKAPPKLPWFLGGITLPSIPEKAPPEMPRGTALPSIPEKAPPKLPWFLGGITLPGIPEKAPPEMPRGTALPSIPEKAPPKLPWFLGGITLPSIPEKAPPELPGISRTALPSIPERTLPKLPWFLGGITLPSIPEKAPPELPGISGGALPSTPERTPPKLPWFLGGITLPSIPEKAPSETPGISSFALSNIPEDAPPEMPRGTALPSIPEKASPKLLELPRSPSEPEILPNKVSRVLPEVVPPKAPSPSALPKISLGHPVDPPPAVLALEGVAKPSSEPSVVLPIPPETESVFDPPADAQPIAPLTIADVTSPRDREVEAVEARQVVSAPEPSTTGSPREEARFDGPVASSQPEPEAEAETKAFHEVASSPVEDSGEIQPKVPEEAAPLGSNPTLWPPSREPEVSIRPDDVDEVPVPAAKQGQEVSPTKLQPTDPESPEVESTRSAAFDEAPKGGHPLASQQSEQEEIALPPFPDSLFKDYEPLPRPAVPPVERIEPSAATPAPVASQQGEQEEIALPPFPDSLFKDYEPLPKPAALAFERTDPPVPPLIKQAELPSQRSEQDLQQPLQPEPPSGFPQELGLPQVESSKTVVPKRPETPSFKEPSAHQTRQIDGGWAVRAENSVSQPAEQIHPEPGPLFNQRPIETRPADTGNRQAGLGTTWEGSQWRRYSGDDTDIDYSVPALEWGKAGAQAPLELDDEVVRQKRQHAGLTLYGIGPSEAGAVPEKSSLRQISTEGDEATSRVDSTKELQQQERASGEPGFRGRANRRKKFKYSLDKKKKKTTGGSKSRVRIYRAPKNEDQEAEKIQGGESSQCGTCGTVLPAAQTGNCPVCAQGGPDVILLTKTSYRFSGAKFFAAADSVSATTEVKEIFAGEPTLPLANLRYWPKIPGHRDMLQVVREE
jgi:hypothetical protein